MRFNRPNPIAWFFFLSAFATCVALGTWQVQRLQWKQGLIAEIGQAKTLPPLTTLPNDSAALEKLNFRPVKLSGTWLHEIEYHLAPRYYQGKFGYALFTPLQLKGKRVILVNRGWVPADKKDIGKRRETIVAGRGTVTGILRVGKERNYFTPPNDPKRNLWFDRDVAEMAATYEVKNVIPATVDAVGAQDIDKLPVPSDGQIRLKNDHLSYVFTWYLIALGILIIFLTYHRRK